MADQDPWGGPDPSHRQPAAIQTHASIALGDSWNQTEPVLIATSTKSNGGSSKIKLCLHRSLNLGKGTLLDSENVNARDKSADHFPFLGMADPNFGQNIQADRDFPVPGSGIYNRYPRANGENRITSVGHGNTLVMIKAMLHFSVMPTHGPSMRPRSSQFPLVRLSSAARNLRA